jgi:hypothetical protein
MESEIKKISYYRIRLLMHGCYIIPQSKIIDNKFLRKHINKNINVKFFIALAKKCSREYVDERVLEKVRIEFLVELKKVYGQKLNSNIKSPEDNDYIAYLLTRIDTVVRAKILFDENFKLTKISGSKIYRIQSGIQEWLIQKCDKDEFTDDIFELYRTGFSYRASELIHLFPQKFSKSLFVKKIERMFFMESGDLGFIVTNLN